jgi:hypothetical protein
MQQTKFWIKDIKPHGVTVDMLTVCSYELNVYLVKVCVGDNTGLVKVIAQSDFIALSISAIFLMD